MTLAIVTDSASDLPEKIVRQYNITVIPLIINIASQEFQDGAGFSRQEFYKRLPEFNPPPTTAVPGPDIFRRAYEQLAAAGATAILSLHISESLSALVNIARIAAKETLTIPVTVFDSRQLSLGLGFQVLAAAQFAAAGLSVEEILAHLNKQIARTYTFAALDTLEFIHRSGRVNIAVSTLGNILQIKPFLKVYEGRPVSTFVRTRAGAHKRLIGLLKEFGPYERVALLHSGAKERAQELLQEVRRLLPLGEILFEEVSPVLGVHLGPGAIGFACVSQNNTGG
ncbi:MAG: DegV family protein [Anaerolineaceae bacterium]|nr:DegV family protein [Anaerolineaceae bacterium]